MIAASTQLRFQQDLTISRASVSETVVLPQKIEPPSVAVADWQTKCWRIKLIKVHFALRTMGLSQKRGDGWIVMSVHGNKIRVCTASGLMITEPSTWKGRGYSWSDLIRVQHRAAELCALGAPEFGAG